GEVRPPARGHPDAAVGAPPRALGVNALGRQHAGGGLLRATPFHPLPARSSGGLSEPAQRRWSSRKALVRNHPRLSGAVRAHPGAGPDAGATDWKDLDRLQLSAAGKGAPHHNARRWNPGARWLERDSLHGMLKRTEAAYAVRRIHAPRLR